VLRRDTTDRGSGITDLMRAAVVSQAGSAPDALRVEELAPPEPGPGEVRVRVRLSGVNPTDWKEREGRGPGAFPFKVPNQDGAGTIESVGEGVDEGRVGERVWLFFAAWERQWGTAAEYTVLPAAQAVPLPDGASDELGASLGIPALTAHRCLYADGEIDGRSVLVAGGAGAVGHAAIQLARGGGAHVVATVSSDEKAALARAAGAHEVVNYRDPDATAQVRAAAPEGVHRVVEVALGANLELDRAVIGPHAAICAYAGGGETRFSAGDLLAPNVVLRFVLVYTMPEEAVRAAVADVSAAVAAGALTTQPLHRFGLDEIGAAHDAVKGGAVGKVLVEV
jgi:NADPH:quinone reductase